MGSSMHTGQQDVFIDTIIRNTSLSKVVSEEDSDDEYSESYEDSFSNISESSSSESFDDDLFIDSICKCHVMKISSTMIWKT